MEIDGDFNKMIKLRKNFVEKGIFLRPFANCIYTMPALNIKKKQLQKITDGILEVLST